MATTEREGVRKRNRITLAVGLIAVGLLLVVILATRSPPQIGPDREVFDTVDALFTAVTAKDERLLSECERRLRAHRDAGKLPPAAAAELDRIIRKARAGSWQPAAERLYDFMKGQRRDGATGHGRTDSDQKTSKPRGKNK